MTKSDLELFKEALTEGLSIRFQNEIDNFEGEVVISERHERAMRTIFNGVQVRPFVWPSTRAKIAAAVIAATMLLASCAAAYSDEIRDFIETICEDYISVDFENSDEALKHIEEYYELTYLPEGYYIKDRIQRDLLNRYVLENNQGKTIIFNQIVLNNSFNLDSESGEQYMLYIDGKEIYCRDYYGTGCSYIWNDGKYSLTIHSTDQIDEETLGKMIDGIKIQE
jgi:hypothetical protein